MADKSRRQFNKLVGSVALVPLTSLLASRHAIAAEFVDPESAAAKGLKFVLESEVEDQNCSGCLFYTSEDDTAGKCIIFTGSKVPATGWCTSFQGKKTP